MSPEVSVCITTYFHEKYIKQAIESVLSQETSFPLEICVSDDCSKDETAAILKEYADKYENVSYEVNEHNIGLSENMFKAKTMGKGKYLVMLSGDDYYIDNHKLQKQYDFLESNPEYFGVCTCVETRADNHREGIEVYPPKEFRNKEFTLEEFLKGNDYPLSGIMYRNCLLEKDGYEYFSIMPKISKYIDDLTDCILILRKGRVFVLPDICTAYRIRIENKKDKNFNSSNKGLSIFYKHMDLLNSLYATMGSEIDLYYRYKKIMVGAWLKSFAFREHIKYLKKCSSVPQEYKNRHIYLRTILEGITGTPRKVTKFIKKKVK